MTRAETAREAALLMLSQRAYASRALLEKLMAKGYSDDEAGDAVRWLNELGYLDDPAYAASVIRLQRAKGYGPRRISQYLQAQGLSREDAENALSGDCGSEDAGGAEEAVDAFLSKRARGPIDEKEKERLTKALLRRGFDFPDIRAGFERLCEEEN